MQQNVRPLLAKESNSPEFAAVSIIPSITPKADIRKGELPVQGPADAARTDNFVTETSITAHPSVRRDICMSFNNICALFKVAYGQIQQGDFHSYSSSLVDVSSRVEHLRASLISYTRK